MVLVYWIRYEPSFGGWAGGEYVDSEEAVTGPDGRFVVLLRGTYTIPLITKVSGPEIVILKPGYGQWRIEQAAGTDGKDGEDLIELPPLKTREERVRFHTTIIRPTDLVPPERMKGLTKAWEEDRAYLGFGR